MEIPSFDLTSSHWNVIETYKFTDNIETTSLRDIDPDFVIIRKLKPGSSDTGGLTGTLSYVSVKTGVQNSRRQKRQFGAWEVGEHLLQHAVGHGIQREVEGAVNGDGDMKSTIGWGVVTTWSLPQLYIMSM